jgi:hypothetical protein
MKRKHFIQYLFLELYPVSISSIAQTVGKTYAVPLAGSCFITAEQAGEAEISGRNGLVKWSSDQEVVSVYFRAQKAGKLTLKLKAKTMLENPK